MRWCCYSSCVWYADFAQREGSKDLALFNQSQHAFTLAPFNCKLVDHNITSSQLRLSLFFNMLTICFFSIQYWVEKHSKMYPICFKFQATQVSLGSLHSNWQLYWGKWVLHSHSEIKVQCFPVVSTQDLGTHEVPTHKGQLLCTYCVDIPIQMILRYILSSTETIDIWTVSLLHGSNMSNNETVQISIDSHNILFLPSCFEEIKTLWIQKLTTGFKCTK